MIERLAGLGMDRHTTGHLLPTPDPKIDIAGFNFDANTPTPSAFCGQQSCAGPKKGIDYKLTARRHIKKCVHYQTDGFHCRMRIEVIVAVGAAAAVVGAVMAGQRKPEPALIPIPVKRPRRSSDD